MTEQTANPLTVIRQNLTAMAPEFKAALPPHVSVEKFSRVAMTAIQNTPALANADRRSLFGAFVKLAQDGLLPDGREAAIVMFGDKAQAMPMIGGVLKRIRQSGEVAKVSAQVVHENDHFIVRYGFDEDVEHSPPKLDEPRGKPIGAYATAVLKDGSRLLEVMSLEEIEKVRAVSRAKSNGPWVAWWGEMARKTVMRRLSKRLPMSTDLEEQVFSRDDTLANAPVEQMIEAETTRPLTRLEAIESQIDSIDEQTGEITGPDETDDRRDDDPPAPEVNDQDETPTDTFGLTPADEPHPAQAKADAIIAEINDASAIIDVNSIYSRHKADIEAMPGEIGARVDIAADKRKAAIGVERKKAKEPAA